MNKAPMSGHPCSTYTLTGRPIFRPLSEICSLEHFGSPTSVCSVHTWAAVSECLRVCVGRPGQCQMSSSICAAVSEHLHECVGRCQTSSSIALYLIFGDRVPSLHLEIFPIDWLDKLQESSIFTAPAP